MEITNHWKKIKYVCEKSSLSSLYYSVATVSEDGTPNIAPIGALFLQESGKG